MTASVGLGLGNYTSGNLSQYLEANTGFSNSGSAINSIYGYGGTGLLGGTYGYGLANDSIYQYAENSIDNATSLQFAQQGNQYTLNSYNEVMQKEVASMADALREGEYGKASQIYREVYDTISKKNGEELTEKSQRVDYDRAVRATISNMYKQINGSTISDDVNSTGEGYFMTGFMQGVTGGNYHKNSAEEQISYMTGDSIEGYAGKKTAKIVGAVVGEAVNISAYAGAGAAIGAACSGGALAIPGAIVGAAVGGVVSAVSWLFGNNSTDTVDNG